MVTLPTRRIFWRNQGDGDSAWIEDADGTFAPGPGQAVEVVSVGASPIARAVADTTPAISGLSNVAETADQAITALDVSSNTSGTNLRYSLSGPSWLAISASGVITGDAPNENRVDTVTVTVSNAAGAASDSFDLTLTGATAPAPATWASTIPDLSATYGAAVVINTALRAEGDEPLSYSMTGPAWLSINSTTGQITGTAPSEDLSTSATVTVSNQVGSDQDTFAVNVSDVQPPDFEFFAEDGSTVNLAAEAAGLRVSLDGGTSWQTLTAAGLGISTGTNALTITGFADAAAAANAQFHYEQEQPGEPYNAPNSVAGIYTREVGATAPRNTDLPGLALAPTNAGAPIT